MERLQNGGLGLGISAQPIEFVHEQPQHMDASDSEDEMDSQDEAEYSDELSSSPSVPDEDIDFEHVYALHTFLATVEGQASVSKGDSLTLLDDSNSYWWLVRVLKTQGVGYIPAENIETPYERLARLNKHRNVDLTGVTQEDHLNGPGSAAAVTRIVPPIHNISDQKPRTRYVAPPGGKSVAFTAPTYYEHSGNEYTESEDESHMMEGSQVDGFEEESDEEAALDAQDAESEVRAYDMDEMDRDHDGDVDSDMEQTATAVMQDRGPKKPLPFGTEQVSSRPITAVLHEQQEQQQLYQRDVTVQPLRQPFRPRQAQQAEITDMSARAASPAPFDPMSNDTQKISLTPRIAMDGTFETTTPPVQQQEFQQRVASTGSMTRSGSTDSMSTSGEHSPRKLTKQTHQKAESTSSVDSANTNGVAEKPVKKKSGVFGNLFSRKKKDKTELNKSTSSNGSSSGRSGALSPTMQSSTSSFQSTLSAPLGDSVSSDRSNGNDAGARSPSEMRSWKDNDDYLAEQTLRQQHIEAQQAMLNQYGISRPPGSQVNSFVPAAASAVEPRAALAPTTNNNLTVQGLSEKKARPGSLIGTPAVLGADAPVLNVLRVFASDSVQCEATFKTVLLSQATTTSELLKQALQRFRLPLDRPNDFFLTVKELGGAEEELHDTDKPLVVFQTLSDALSAVPAVKRSSISSISSMSSTISNHPAIAKLGMNDFSDDSTVKIYINYRTLAPNNAAHVTDSQVEYSANRQSMNGTARFTLRVLIFPEDLPDTLAFDPSSPAIIPTAILAERKAAQPTIPVSGHVSMHMREKIMLMPSNATVSEVVETALDRFGIMGGVVEGGDDVETKLPNAKRRSATRMRYNLVMTQSTGETVLPPNKKILDSYATQPILKQQQVNPKEARRRSADLLASFTANASDIQPTDPVFVLRQAQSQVPSPNRKPMPTLERQESQYATPPEELPSAFEARSKQEIIVAQRAASRATQHAMLSAYKNADQGVDILLHDGKGKIRSSRSLNAADADSAKVRYSYIDAEGSEFDISDIVEAEWSTTDLPPRSASTMSVSDSGFASAPTSPQSITMRLNQRNAVPRDDDEDAVEAVRNTLLTIGTQPTSLQSEDKLEEALQPHSSPNATATANGTRTHAPSTAPHESLEQRIDRVLSKVKSNQRASSGLATSLRQNLRQSSASTGRTTPLLEATSAQGLDGRLSPLLAGGSANGRISPAVSGRASPAFYRPSSSLRSTPQHQPRHLKQLSLTSLNSDHSQSNSSASASSAYGSPHTAPSAVGTSFTTISPATRNGSSQSQRIVYPADLGLDNLLAMVGGDPMLLMDRDEVVPPVPLEHVFGGASTSQVAISDAEVRAWHDTTSLQLEQLDRQLDNLLLQVLS